MGQNRSQDKARGPVGFAMVPRAILRDPTLSNGAKILTCLLVSYAWQDGNCFPGQKRLAAEAGWRTVKTVQRALSELEAKGKIRKERRGFMKTNRYVLLFDPAGGHGGPVRDDTSVPHDATPVSHYYSQLPRDSRLKAVPPDDFSYSGKERKRRSYPNREEVVRRFREQLAAAGGGPDMEQAVAMALSARLKCSLEEAFQLLGDGQGDVEKG